MMVGADMAPFHVMDMVKAAAVEEARGRSIVHLEVGQPSTGAPGPVCDAAAAALGSGDPLGYTEVKGLPALRDALAAHYRAWYGVDIDPVRIQLTGGSSAGFVLAFLACFERGARVGVPVPGYPCYRNVLQGLGMVPIPVRADASSGYRVTVDLLDAAGPLDGLLLASPNNPTGTVLARAELAEVAGWCAEREVRLISDEIYHGLVYGEPASSMAAIEQRAIVVSSFSKYWSMTGWRLGWLNLPHDDEARVERLAANLFICPAAIAQHAALAAVDGRAGGFAAIEAELSSHVARYRRNRTVLLEGLPRAGLRSFAPADGAFYLYADVSELGVPSSELCQRWLVEAGVATAPGVDFDPEWGSRFVRFSFAGSTPDMVRAVERLVAWSERA